MLPKLVRELVTCPLSGQVMHDPVFASDGYVYERRVLEKWMESNTQSPVTQEALGRTVLPANLIAQFIRLVGRQPFERKLTMPSKYIGYLIGKRGRTIHKIQSSTGTKIAINQTQEPSILTFSGGDIERAVKFASEVIANLPLNK
jgi:predicted PilT family ATPase